MELIHVSGNTDCLLGKTAVGIYRIDDTRCILFDNADDISAGSKVARTGKTAGVPVGDAFLGRVVDALGRPIDGGDAIPADGYRPVEEPAPGIIDRQS